MTITAVILSSTPVAMTLPDGVVALNHNESFTTTAQIHMARRRAIAAVRTRHFFFLDSDDKLPDDAGSVLADCVAADKPLAYTDELVIDPEGNAQLFKRREYDAHQHARVPMFVHHLALLETAAARRALREIPSGDYWIEHLLYFQTAKAGAAYIPRTGYHWYRGPTGMHAAPGIIAAQLRAAGWCVRNPD